MASSGFKRVYDLESVPNNTDEECTRVIPNALHSFYREDGRPLGYLAIDSDINGISVGGIRMVAEMPVGDLCHLARTMTLKYSFLNWPFGGAKALILTHCDDPSPQQRREALESFARCLTPFRGRYLPGEDVGTTAEDLLLIRRLARFEKMRYTPDSAYHTALTVRICVEQLLREQGLNPADCTVAIEGFGKVGGWVARLLGELGCQIIAVSTGKGAVYCPDGLDVEELLQARASLGDSFTGKFDPSYQIEIPQLFRLPVDIIIPCALSWSIDAATADEICARMVVCGANNAVTDKAKEILAARGITCMPDFVANSGGVLGSMIEMLCMDRARAVEILRQQFEPKVEGLLTREKETGQSLETIARDIAAANYREMKKRQNSAGSKLTALTAFAYRYGLLPKMLVKLFAPTYIRKTMQ